MDKTESRIVKVVFERDYTQEPAQPAMEINPEIEALVCDALELYQYQKALPHVVDKQAAAEFGRMVAACDLLAKEFSGSLTAVVDYEKYYARIIMEFVFLEFRAGEFMDILLALAIEAIQVRFEPTPSDFFKLVISMPYFTPAP